MQRIKIRRYDRDLPWDFREASTKRELLVDVSDNKEQIMIREEECGTQRSELVPKL